MVRDLTDNLIDLPLMQEYDDNLKSVARLLQRNHAYAQGDVVNYKGVQLQCDTAGTTAGTTLAGLTNAKQGDTLMDGTVKWLVIAVLAKNIKAVIEEWLQNTLYIAKDVVIYNSLLYMCKASHTSATQFSTDRAKWVALTNVFTYGAGQKYNVGDIVIEDGVAYVVDISITPTGTFATDAVNFTKLRQNVATKIYADSRQYDVGDVVLKNNKLWHCIKKYTSTDADDLTNWRPVQAYIPQWEALQTYNVDDLVTYNDIIYICVLGHTSTSKFESSYWKALSNKGTGGSSGIGGLGYSQLDVSVTTVPYTIKVSTTANGYLKSPLEILKQSAVQTGVSDTVNLIESNWELTDFIEIDNGTMRQKNTYDVNITDIKALSSGYVQTSEEIDFSAYKTVESVI